MSRKGFLAMLGVSAATLAVSGCQPKELEPITEEQVQEIDFDNGTWVTAACWQTCHCGCVNKALVVDGIPVQQKTDDNHPDSPDFPQQRSCIKGRSLRQFVMGADRLKYPMKRKSWSPGGGEGVNAHLRGRDEWERISWEEALDYTANEFLRIRDTYGNLAIASRILDQIPYLNAFGGYITVWGQQSNGGNVPPYTAMRGNSYSDKTPGDRISLRKAKLIVLWGYNPIYSAGGSNTNYVRHAKDAGAKIIAVDPWFSPSAQALADEWVPVRPGTDTALLAAIAYHMIENDLQDQEFLDAYTVGFDADHMPEGEEGQENFKDYILGAYDGTPKTPEWASAICGTAPSVIRDLAEQMATTKPMTLRAGQAPERVYNGVEFTQMYLTVGWMTGNVGKPGAEVEAADGSSGVQGGPSVVSLGPTLMKNSKNPVCTTPRGGGTLDDGSFDPSIYHGIAYAEFWTAILDGVHTDFQNGENQVDIRCLVKFGRCSQINQNLGLSKAVEALRKPDQIEFNVTSEFFMTPDCQYSDIVLPCATPWEYEGGHIAAINKETIVMASKVIEPVYESMPNWWINKELCLRTGIDPLELGPEDPELDPVTRLAESTVKDDDGEKVNLAEVTAEDIAEFGLATEPHEGRVPLKKLIEDGGYQVERKDGDRFMYTALSEYIDDPAANPLETRSGKLEIFCRDLEERIANYNTTTVAPIAKYVPALEGYEDSFSDWEGKVKGEYPYQLLGIHILRQAHSSFGNVKSIAEVFANDLILNEADAGDIGVVTGDTVLLSNPHGKGVRRVQVASRVMPGVAIIGQGNWIELDDETGIDMGCNINSLTGPHLVSSGLSPYNTVLVKIEKWDGAPLEPDYLRPQVIMNV
jgi:anaerobic dimethyl sulfoxide reductase subunit A